MTNRTRSLALSLAMLLSACNGGSRSPTAASIAPTPVPAPIATYTLSGAVSEDTPTGLMSVGGVLVEEANTHRTTITDADGFYSISGLAAMGNLVTVSKAGYIQGTRTVTISGDTRFDIRVDRIPSHTLSGEVFETTAAGRLPVEGVEVYCDSCGSPVGHTFAYTDAEGLYRFAWTYNGSNPLFVKKPGYAIVDPTGTLLDALGRVNVTVNGDTRFDVELARR